MDIQKKMAGTIRFGAFELDLKSGELRKSGLKIHLREQPFRILAMLLERPGEIITREEIQKALWPNDTVVEYEHSVNAAIKALRAALSDDADNPRFVETLPRRGYRFIAPVSSTGVPPVNYVGPGLAPALAADAKRPTQGSALPIEGARYRLLEKLGAGGMGEVWRACDTKLNRDVALKFLSEDFASDHAALERFKREAQLASSLNHPHICAIYDTGELDGRQFISMELVEGETLAKRLSDSVAAISDRRPDEKIGGQRPPLQFEQVLEYGIEIAGALAAAHRLGIIHRDLKPQNIMLTKSGTKLLDFGLAKLTPATAGMLRSAQHDMHGDAAHKGAGVTLSDGEGSPDSPTATVDAESLTAQGAIMGTLHYMAPEQLEGKPADARTDIFAFGCVLYEMATGRRAFEGESSAQAMAAIMQNDPPPITNVGPNGVRPLGQQDAPNPVGGENRSPLQRVVMKCLAKDPDDRWQTAADLRDELKWIKEGEGAGTGTPGYAMGALPSREQEGTASRAPTKALPWVLAAVGLVGCVVLAILAARNTLQPKTEESAIRFSISPPENTSFHYYTGGTYSGGFSLSPDGRRLAFLTGTLNPWIGTQLWVRSLDELAAKPLPGTEGASYPFWSPDGRYLGFIADGKLKKVEVAGGPPQTLCDAGGVAAVLTQQGGTWNREGVIVFVSHGSLYRISEAGGAPTLVAEPDAARQETYYYLPQFLPDGRHFLVFAASRLGMAGAVRGGSIKVGSLDSKRTKVLLQAGSSGMYTATGYMLYLRDAILMARRFDAKSLRFTEEAVPIAENIGFDPVGGAYFSVSQNGVLAYQTRGYPSGANNQMVWFGRKGEKLGNVGQTGSYTNPALSPDGAKLAVGLFDPKLNTRDIWVYDLKRGTSSRLTFNPADDFAPVWSHDGSRIMFSSDRKGQRDIYQKPTNGLGATESVFESKQQRKSVGDWSPDGRYVVFSTFENDIPSRSLWVLPLFGDRTPYTIVQGRSYIDSAQFSPNGRYVAYSADETGRPEIYVQTFPERGGKWQVSTGGGIEPMWRHDGKELFYLTLDNKVMAVDVKTDLSQFEAGAQKPLFQVQLIPGGWRNRYVVSPDGQRFLMIVPAGEAKPSPITVVVNWPALLKNNGK